MPDIEHGKLITAEDVTNAIRDHKITRWVLRTCGICHAPLAYEFNDGRVQYDSNCHCTRYYTPPNPRTIDDVVRVFNMQSPDVRARMWNKFIASGT